MKSYGRRHPGTISPVRMKRLGLLVVWLALCAAPAAVVAQSEVAERVEAASQRLSSGSLDEAWELLSGIDTPQAQLFKAKILYQRGEFDDALERLDALTGHSLPALREEAVFTRALVQFQRKEYADALAGTAELQRSALTSVMRRDAGRLHESVLHWMSASQAEAAIQDLRDRAIIADIIRIQIGKLDLDAAKTFYERHRFQLRGQEGLTQELEGALSSAARHAAFARTVIPVPPEAVVYRVGVVLPDADSRSDLFDVTRSLYTGIQVATDTYNAANSNRKIQLHFFKLDEDLRNARELKGWSTERRIDALIGPLTSNSVNEVGRRLDGLDIPLITPLANDPTVGRAYAHLYQVNPGINARGTGMADFAHGQLKYRSFAVLIDADPAARAEAEAFERRIQELGGEITYRFDQTYIADPERLDRELQHLTTDPFMIDSLQLKPVDALYIALGQDNGEALFNLAVTGLDLAASRVAILGTQPLNLYRVSGRVKRDYHVYTYSPYDDNPLGTKVTAFNNSFRQYSGFESDVFGYLGHDVLQLVAQLGERWPNPSDWPGRVSHLPPSLGLTTPIDFDGGRENRRLFYYKLVESGKIRMGE